ncbi:MAG: alanine racemase [Verrucomicrobia bacterium]|nr:alanine racemase [Verrucomicrobiota bacterium]
MSTGHTLSLHHGGAWVEVHLDTLADNIRAVRAVLPSCSDLIFVVKASAYGHGLLPIAEAAANVGVKWFGVAYLDEAVALRKILPEAKILVMGAVDARNAELMIRHRLTPVIVSAEHGALLAEAAGKCVGTLEAHLKVDSGMGRLGVSWQDAEAVLKDFQTDASLNIRGLMTHFATVEPSRPELASKQVERMLNIPVFKAGSLFRHASSSRAFLFHPEWDFDAVRAGISLYGYGADEDGLRFKTHPILEWKTRVMQVKQVPADFPVGYYSSWRSPAPTEIATIAVGYADGFKRLLSNRGHVLINGRRCGVVGRVSMNWVTVDVGADSGVKAGDEVVLIGRQGHESIWADEVAGLCSTIAYEVLTSINPAAERVYLG